MDLRHGRYVNDVFEDVPGNTVDAKLPRASMQNTQLNHYLLKSWEEFTAKRARGNASRAPEAVDKYTHRGSLTAPPLWSIRKTPQNEYWITHDLNLCTDQEAKKSADAVRTRMSQWSIDAPPPSEPILSLRERMAISWRRILSHLRSP